MNLLRTFCCFCLLMLAACVSASRPPLVYTPGTAIESLSSTVSLSVHSRTGNMSGSGLFLYRSPDRFHFALLSPFGSTLLEAYALGERLTLVYPSQSVAFTGAFSELPNGSGMEGWRLLRWVMDAVPGQPGRSGTVQRESSVVGTENVVYEAGLVTSKTTPAGDRVDYRKHELLNGIPFAMEVELRTANNDRIRLKFDEPEANATLEEISFAPRLSGMRVLPLEYLPPAVAKK